MAIKLHKSDTSFQMYINDHRGAIVKCPHCNKNISHSDWFEPDNIKEIFLRSKYNKSNTAIVISECPACFESSWIHKKLSDLAKTLTCRGCRDLADAINDEIHHRKEKHKNSWDESDCRRCQHLMAYDTSSSHVKRECRYGRGLIVLKCQKFKPKKNIT
jgi:hypothetical protein